jgi:hypothetical protein
VGKSSFPDRQLLKKFDKTRIGSSERGAFGKVAVSNPKLQCLTCEVFRILSLIEVLTSMSEENGTEDGWSGHPQSRVAFETRN